MGIVISSTPTYASVDDVRAFPGLPEATDAQINNALELAVEMIDDFTGSTFGDPSIRTVIVNDVRKPLLPLPSPFSSVTAVAVNGVDLTSSQWVVESWGLRLYSIGHLDSDGFPRYDWPSGVAYDWTTFGGQVAVTGVFGYPSVPAKVRQAAILLAVRTVTTDISSMVPDDRIKRLSVEGYSVDYGQSTKTLTSTGDDAVDRLLARYVSVDGMVA